MNRATLLKEINLDQFIALDFETTGLQVKTDRIIEVAAILFENGEPTKRFTSLVKPGIPIPTLIENITGITNKMVEDAPSEKDIIDDFFKFISNYKFYFFKQSHWASFNKGLTALFFSIAFV